MTSLCFYRKQECMEWGISQNFIVASEGGGQDVLLRTYNHTTTWW